MGTGHPDAEAFKEAFKNLCGPGNYYRIARDAELALFTTETNIGYDVGIMSRISRCRYAPAVIVHACIPVGWERDILATNRHVIGGHFILRMYAYGSVLPNGIRRFGCTYVERRETGAKKLPVYKDKEGCVALIDGHVFFGTSMMQAVSLASGFVGRKRIEAIGADLKGAV